MKRSEVYIGNGFDKGFVGADAHIGPCARFTILGIRADVGIGPYGECEKIQ